jgi:hypothetical protein
MTIAIATTARFVAHTHAATVDLARVVLRDVEDLHDADQELLLADKLADAYDAADMAIALARLLGAPAPSALDAHALDARAALLAD